MANDTERMEKFGMRRTRHPRPIKVNNTISAPDTSAVKRVSKKVNPDVIMSQLDSYMKDDYILEGTNDTRHTVDGETVRIGDSRITLKSIDGLIDSLGYHRLGTVFIPVRISPDESGKAAHLHIYTFYKKRADNGAIYTFQKGIYHQKGSRKDPNDIKNSSVSHEHGTFLLPLHAKDHTGLTDVIFTLVKKTDDEDRYIYLVRKEGTPVGNDKRGFLTCRVILVETFNRTTKMKQRVIIDRRGEKLCDILDHDDDSFIS